MVAVTFSKVSIILQ